MQIKLTQQRLILYVSILLVVLYNYPFFSNTLKVYPCSLSNCSFIFSLAVLLTAATHFFLTLISSKFTTKPFLIIIVLISSFTTYFMSTYNVVIDDSMIRNALQTDLEESLDLLSIKLFLYLIILGLLPAYLIYSTQIIYKTTKSEFFAKLKAIAITLLLSGIMIYGWSKHYTSFFREHKVLRFYTNPLYWIYSTGWYIQDSLKNKNHTLQKIGTDATIDTNTTRTIVFMVVGEAARADHFSLNGYKKETNPKLQSEDIINLSNLYSCGTSTAHSVPCMFSILTRDEYSYQKALYTENVLDVLKHTNKVAILWRDNNSDSKGVALRVEHQDYKTPKNNPLCDEECRDVGMLQGLDKFIEQHKDKNVLIVLHQMGNHGPAYYKRYTKTYEKFTPTCKTNQLEECSKEEISNAYDNALAYTDDFLFQTLQLAKQFPNDNVAVVYMSDHGESLGENGIYLHGLPYFIAPDAQKHVGAFVWLNKHFQNYFNQQELQKLRTKRLSHDNLFHTLLGLFQVKTEVYDKQLDLLYPSRKTIEKIEP